MLELCGLESGLGLEVKPEDFVSLKNGIASPALDQCFNPCQGTEETLLDPMLHFMCLSIVVKTFHSNSTLRKDINTGIPYTMCAIGPFCHSNSHSDRSNIILLSQWITERLRY